MMENLRTAANNPVIKIVFAIIILSFILTGVGGYLVSGSNYAAKVNDTEISVAPSRKSVTASRLSWVTCSRS